MKDEKDDQAEHVVWVNKEQRIVTFRETEGYEKRTFQTQDEKISCIYRLCESGYRIL